MIWTESRRIVVFFFLIFASSSPVGSQELDDLFTGLDERQKADVMCPPLLAAEFDVLQAMGPNAPREIVFDCSRVSDPLSGDLEISDTKKVPSSLGGRILEGTNKWGWNSAGTGMIVISNPYPSPILSITLEFFDGSCSSISDPTYFKLAPSAPIEPDSTRIVRFDAMQLNHAGRDACLKIVDVNVKPVTNASRKLTEAIALARAEQWHESGVLMDLAIRSGASLDSHDAEQLHDVLYSTVRALPASESLRNRDAYLLLAFLRPEEADYERRLERYQSASKEERMGIIFDDILSRAPVVLFGQVASELSSSRTSAQRDSSWSGFKDKRISIYGSVTNVRPDGSLLNARIEMDLEGTNSGVCMVKSFLNEAAQAIEIGDQINCSGSLSNYTLLFGVLTILVNEAEFTK